MTERDFGADHSQEFVNNTLDELDNRRKTFLEHSLQLIDERFPEVKVDMQDFFDTLKSDYIESIISTEYYPATEQLKIINMPEFDYTHTAMEDVDGLLYLRNRANESRNIGKYENLYNKYVGTGATVNLTGICDVAFSLIKELDEVNTPAIDIPSVFEVYPPDPNKPNF